MFWFLLSAASPSHCTLSTQSQAKILFYTLPSAHLLTALCVFRTVWSFGSSAASHSLCSLHSHQNPVLHTPLGSVAQCFVCVWDGLEFWLLSSSISLTLLPALTLTPKSFLHTPLCSLPQWFVCLSDGSVVGFFKILSAIPALVPWNKLLLSNENIRSWL